jgi:multicomponent Na+:H+ antiporter subunit F
VSGTILLGAALLAMTLALVRIARGPRHADRIVAIDLLFATGVACCIAAALVTGRPEFLDVGMGLALVGFVATIAWARLIKRSVSRRDAESPPS